MTAENNHCLEIQVDPRGEQWSDGARKHAAVCPACRAYLESCRALEGRLKELPSSRETMPAELRATLLEQLAEAAGHGSPTEQAGAFRPTASRRQRVLVSMAMAASLVLGIVLGNALEFGDGKFPVEVPKTIGLYIEDVTHDHFLLERLGRPLEIEITDPRALSEWLSHSLSFDFSLPSAHGTLSLQGGRVWHTVGRLSALASYKMEGGGRLVLFAVPAENLYLEGAESHLVGSTRVFTGSGWEHDARVWIDGDLALALTAPEGSIPAGWEEIFLP